MRLWLATPLNPWMTTAPSTFRGVTLTRIFPLLGFAISLRRKPTRIFPLLGFAILLRRKPKIIKPKLKTMFN